MNNPYYEDVYTPMFMQSQIQMETGAKLADIHRLQAFSKRARELSLLGLYRKSESEFFSGYGVKSKYISRQDHDKLIEGEFRRRVDSLKYTYGSYFRGNAQLSRDFANTVGLGDIYDKTVGLSDLQYRTTLNNAENLSEFVAATLTRRDMRGEEARGLETQYNLADIMANQRALSSIVSDSKIQDFIEASGYQNYQIFGINTPFLTETRSHFSQDEKRQIAYRGLLAGEYSGAGAIYDIDPYTGRRVPRKFANSQLEKEEVRKKYILDAALTTEKLALNLKNVQEEFGITDAEEAFNFAKTISGDKKISDLNRSDIYKIQEIKKQLNLSNEAIKAYLEAGDDVAKNIGVTTTQGRALTLSTLTGVNNLRSLGVIGDTSAAAVGGTQGLQQQIGGAYQRIAASDGGQLYRGGLAFIEMVREAEGDEVADALAESLKKEFSVKGRVSRDTVSKLAVRAGYSPEEFSPAYIDTALKARSGLIDSKVSGINVEADQLSMLLDRAKKMRPNVSSQIRYLKDHELTQDLHEETLRNLLTGKETSREALVAKGEGFKEEELASKLLEINDNFSKEEDRRRELESYLKSSSLSGKYDVDSLLDEDTKSFQEMLKHAKESRVGQAELGSWYDNLGLTYLGSFVSDSAEKRRSKLQDYRRSKSRREKIDSLVQKKVASLPESERKRVQEALNNPGAGTVGEDKLYSLTSEASREADYLLEAEKDNLGSWYDNSQYTYLGSFFSKSLAERQAKFEKYRAYQETGILSQPSSTDTYSSSDMEKEYSKDRKALIEGNNTTNQLLGQLLTKVTYAEMQLTSKSRGR